MFSLASDMRPFNIAYKTACVPSEDSDQPAHPYQSPRCTFEDDLDPWLPKECFAKTDQTAQTSRLI